MHCAFPNVECIPQCRVHSQSEAYSLMQCTSLNVGCLSQCTVHSQTAGVHFHKMLKEFTQCQVQSPLQETKIYHELKIAVATCTTKLLKILQEPPPDQWTWYRTRNMHQPRIHLNMTKLNYIGNPQVWHIKPHSTGKTILKLVCDYDHRTACCGHSVLLARELLTDFFSLHGEVDAGVDWLADRLLLVDEFKPARVTVLVNLSIQYHWTLHHVNRSIASYKHK